MAQSIELDGDRIKKHRGEKGLTQDALADKMGVTSRTISTWENTGSVKTSEALRLAEALEVPLEHLKKDGLLPKLQKQHLTQASEEVARALIQIEQDKQRRQEEGCTKEALFQVLGKKIPAEDLYDIAKELKSKGLLDFVADTGGFFLTPTPLLFLFHKEHVSYDPNKDLLEVALALVKHTVLTGPQLAEASGLSDLRVIRAVEPWATLGFVEVNKGLGLRFPWFRAQATRQLKEHLAGWPEAQ